MNDVSEDDLEYLHPILRKVVKTKRALGLEIHLPQYPHLCSNIDIPLITYINAVLDAVIEMRREDCKRMNLPPLYGVPHLLLECLKDEREAFALWSKICHEVSCCPVHVLAYCEKVLRDARKPVPERPESLRLHLRAAE